MSFPQLKHLRCDLLWGKKCDLHAHLKTYLLYESNLGSFTLIIIITTDELFKSGKAPKILALTPPSFGEKVECVIPLNYLTDTQVNEAGPLRC